MVANGEDAALTGADHRIDAGISHKITAPDRIFRLRRLDAQRIALDPTPDLCSGIGEDFRARRSI